MVIEELAFSKEQIEAYEKLIWKHRQNIIEKEHLFRQGKHRLYDVLIQEEHADSIAQYLGKIQTEIELVHYHHFRQLRSICNQEQKEKFDQLDLARVFAPHPHRR